MVAAGCPAEIFVPSDSALKPQGVGTNVAFRLLFVSSTKRNATSTNIAHYNSFVQGRAAAGHSAIQNHSTGFRVLGSTQTVNARANTCTRSSDSDAAVYWLNGAQIADDYAGLYDGSWESSADRLENGNEHTGTDAERIVWTGKNDNGTTAKYLGYPSDHLSRDVTVGYSDDTGDPLKRRSTPK